MKTKPLTYTFFFLRACFYLLIFSKYELAPFGLTTFRPTGSLAHHLGVDFT